MDLRGQKALVLGALGRAGTAVARKFCEEGASVVLSARREAEEFTASLRDEGYDVSFAPADVTSREQVAAAVDATVEQLGRIDILTNCASYDHMRDDEEKHWDRVIAVNYKGTMLGCQEALRHMIPQGYGRIITLVSDSAKIGAALETAQSGAKAAIVAFLAMPDAGFITGQAISVSGGLTMC